jgi:hypothetical protein
MRREMTDHDVVGLGYCDVCGVAGPRCCAALAAAKAARREGERALEEERRMRVQLSDDSQRHLDRALAAEAALAQARAALRKWGQHATYCTWHININTCNCEFGALLTTGGGSE